VWVGENDYQKKEVKGKTFYKKLGGKKAARRPGSGAFHGVRERGKCWEERQQEKEEVGDRFRISETIHGGGTTVAQGVAGGGVGEGGTLEDGEDARGRGGKGKLETIPA